jgi:hypothetical protein
MATNVPVEPALSPERRDEMIEAFARHVTSMGLTTPVLFLLEAHQPLSFLGSQALTILQPFLSLVFDPSASTECALLLEQPDSIERLIRRLETGRAA